MTEVLRSALVEIAERAPAATVPDDLWRSARRSRRGHMAAATVAVLAVVGSVIGLGASAHRDTAPVTQPAGGGAVPSRVYLVPDRLTGSDERGRPTGPVESDLSVGTSSVAYMTQSGIPVVVTARDGRYHLLDLPGFVGESPTSFATLLGGGLTLSPDGRSLAYAYADGYDAAGTPTATGIRVLDLGSGHIRTIELPPFGEGTAIRQIVWSPDSRWLAWMGQVATFWRSGSARFGAEHRGRINPGSATSQELTGPTDSATSIAIDDRGTVAMLATNRLWLAFVGGRVQVRHVHQPGKVLYGDDPPQMTFDTSGHRLALATTLPGHQAYLLTTKLHVGVRRLPPVGGDGASVQPLGWLDAADGPVSVSEVRPHQGDTILDGRIVLTRWGDGRSSTVVARVDDLINNPVSIAVDLMTVAQPTYDFPAPDWPGSDQRRVIMTCLVIGGLGLGWLGLALAARRRRA